MTTTSEFLRANFNGDLVSGPFGSQGDLLLFDNFGNKAIWLEDGSGGRLASAPNGLNLPFTGPTWHIAAATDFDNGAHFVSPGGNNPTSAADLLWENDNGDLAIWQSTGSNTNPFAPGTFQQANLPNPGAGWHVASADDFDANQAADILFQHDLGFLAIWEFQSFDPNHNGANYLQGAPVIKPGGQFNVDQNPGASWHAVATGDIDNDQRAGIVFQNDNGAIAVWEAPNVVGTQIHFSVQSNLPVAGPGWHVVGMGNTTEDAFFSGDDIVLRHDNGSIAIWQLQVVGNQVVRQGTGFNLGNPGPDWHVVGVRDMNLDGHADLLLQNDNGAAAVWTNIQPNGNHSVLNINPNPNPSGHLDWHIE